MQNWLKLRALLGSKEPPGEEHLGCFPREERSSQGSWEPLLLFWLLEWSKSTLQRVKVNSRVSQSSKIAEPSVW